MRLSEKLFVVFIYLRTLNIPAMDSVRLEVQDTSKYSESSMQNATKAPITTAHIE